MDADNDARERVIQQATRQSFVAHVEAVRKNVVIGSALFVIGGAIFAFCIYAAMMIGQVSMGVGALGFLLMVFGGTRIVGGLVRGMTARRRLREIDALALPAARVVAR